MSFTRKLPRRKKPSEVCDVSAWRDNPSTSTPSRFSRHVIPALSPEIDGKKLSGCEKPLVVKRNNLQEEATKSKSNLGSQPLPKEVHVIHHYGSYPMGYSSSQPSPRYPPHYPPVFTAPPFSPEKYSHPYPPFHPPHHSASFGAAHSHGVRADKSPLYVYDPFGGGVPYATVAHVTPFTPLPRLSPASLSRMGAHSAATTTAASQRSSLGPPAQSPGGTENVLLGEGLTDNDLISMFKL